MHEITDFLQQIFIKFIWQYTHTKTKKPAFSGRLLSIIFTPIAMATQPNALCHPNLHDNNKSLYQRLETGYAINHRIESSLCPLLWYRWSAPHLPSAVQRYNGYSYRLSPLSHAHKPTGDTPGSLVIYHPSSLYSKETVCHVPPLSLSGSSTSRPPSTALRIHLPKRSIIHLKKS